MDAVKRARAKRWIGWSAVMLALVLGAACATERLGEGRIWGFGPPPVIKGTDTQVPRAWAADVSPRDWKWIVVHHSASESGGAVVFDEWHRKRGWDELGYHFVIDNGEGQPDGRVEVGSRWLKQKQGAHAKSPSGEYNERGIGICLVGNFEKARPTQAQWAALVKLTTYLSREYGIPADRIIGHHNVNETTLCPGKNLDLEQLRRDVSKFDRGKTQFVAYLEKMPVGVLVPEAAPAAPQVTRGETPGQPPIGASEPRNAGPGRPANAGKFVAQVRAPGQKDWIKPGDPRYFPTIAVRCPTSSSGPLDRVSP